MNVLNQVVNSRYALYNGDACEILPELPDKSIHISVYSPPFYGTTSGLFQYSSSERDLSNARNQGEFFTHYGFIVKELLRITIPGRISAVHTMDVPRDGANLNGGLIDFTGDIIRLHESIGWSYCARYAIWKEPLEVRNRTMAKGLAHKQLVEDSVLCDNAGADYLLMFRKKGTNPIPVAHPIGLSDYAGERPIPPELMKYKGWKGKQTENRLSHLIWRRYASSFWDDIRLHHVLPYKEARDAEDQKHMHPLQLDVIERCLVLWTNPGETLCSPFAGVGSEIYQAVRMGRKGIGIDLKTSYWNQSVRNLATVDEPDQEKLLFDVDGEGQDDLTVIDSLIMADTPDPDMEPDIHDDPSLDTPSEYTTEQIADEPSPPVRQLMSEPPPVPMVREPDIVEPKGRKRKTKKESASPLFSGME